MGLYITRYMQKRLFLFLLYFYNLLDQEAALNLPTTVSISPEKANVGSEVTLTCDFELVSNTQGVVQDLAILFWDKKFGGKVYKYNHQAGKTEEKGDDYVNKIISVNYEESPDPNNVNKRRHTLVLRVDNCDSAIFQCRMYNQNDVTEGLDEKALEVQSNLPNPVVCWNNTCNDLQIFGTSTAQVKCSCIDATVSPILTLTEQIGSAAATSFGTDNVEDNPGCLFDGFKAGYKTIDGDDKDVHKFTCICNYAGTEKSTTLEVSTTRTGSKKGGKETMGLVFGILVPILVILLLAICIFFLIRRKRAKRGLIDETDGESTRLNGLKKGEATDGVVMLFNYNNSEFSNIYQCNIHIDGVNGVFNCPEQFRYYRKAELAGDIDAMEAVLNATDVNKMRILTQNIAQPVDNNTASMALQRAMKAKFTQHEYLRKKLLDTGDKILAEAGRPDDKYYSIGLPLESEHAYNVDKWPGHNITGILLKKVREELRNDLQAVTTA